MLTILILGTLLILEVTALKMADWRVFENLQYFSNIGVSYAALCVLYKFDPFYLCFLFFAWMITMLILGTLCILGVTAQKLAI